MINIDSLGFQSCQNDIDCGIGRFCDSNKICSLECTTSKDCNYIIQAGMNMNALPVADAYQRV